MSKMVLFSKIGKGFQPLTIFAKSSFFDVVPVFLLLTLTYFTYCSSVFIADFAQVKAC